jgi:hypothetical protein
VARWGEFEADEPEVAIAGRKLLYQFRVDLGYLATDRADGGSSGPSVLPDHPR